MGAKANLNARARNGDTYRALFLAATAQGVNPSVLAPGQEVVGKIYFLSSQTSVEIIDS